jgi:hypothetical protein
MVWPKEPRGKETENVSYLGQLEDICMERGELDP